MIKFRYTFGACLGLASIAGLSLALAQTEEASLNAEIAKLSSSIESLNNKIDRLHDSGAQRMTYSSEDLSALGFSIYCQAANCAETASQICISLGHNEVVRTNALSTLEPGFENEPPAVVAGLMCN